MNERIYYSHEAEEQAKRQQLLVVILFAAFGLAIGTALALLFAPAKVKKHAALCQIPSKAVWMPGVMSHPKHCTK